jgi:hypothetical protein
MEVRRPCVRRECIRYCFVHASPWLHEGDRLRADRLQKYYVGLRRPGSALRLQIACRALLRVSFEQSRTA